MTSPADLKMTIGDLLDLQADRSPATATPSSTWTGTFAAPGTSSGPSATALLGD